MKPLNNSLGATVPFPEGLDTVSLPTISLGDLLSEKQSAKERMLDACKSKGFFYLDFAGTTSSLPAYAEQLRFLSEELHHISDDEKERCRYVKGTIHGFKEAGSLKVDIHGTPDTVEMWNIPTNDLLRDVPGQAWPDQLLDRRELTRAFAKDCHSLGLQLFAMIAETLEVPAEEVMNKHKIEEPAGSMVRLTRAPPRKTPDQPEISVPSHTDFGTITVLFTWLGGLQMWSTPNRGDQVNVVDPSEGHWQWVRPKPGCAIVNLGDAAVAFTNGVLCSGRHRVMPAPGEQGMLPRQSVVYFVRPEDAAILEPYQSNLIPAKVVDETNSTPTPPMCTKAWITMRSNQMKRALAT